MSQAQNLTGSLPIQTTNIPNMESYSSHGRIQARRRITHIFNGNDSDKRATNPHRSLPKPATRSPSDNSNNTCSNQHHKPTHTNTASFERGNLLCTICYILDWAPRQYRSASFIARLSIPFDDTGGCKRIQAGLPLFPHNTHIARDGTGGTQHRHYH